MKLGILVFLFGAVGVIPGASASQVGTGNVSNPKMCVCEPCGGIMVPCQNLKKPAEQAIAPSCSGSACSAVENQSALPAKSSN